MGFGQILSIGRSALNSAQLGLEVTGNNIANVNTPNYARQRINQSTAPCVNIGGMPFGTGVEIANIQRIYDSFIGNQANNAYSGLQDFELREQIYSRVNTVLYPSEDSNLDIVIDDFFNAISDLSLSPEGVAERQVVMSKGEEVAANFRSLYRSLDDEMKYTNTQLDGFKDEVNRITSDLAYINSEILRLSGANSDANNLLDRREGLLQELSSYLNITVIEKDQGGTMVMAGGGVALVDAGQSYDISIQPDSDDNNFYRLYSQGLEITNDINSGQINALLQSRAQIAQTRDDIDLLAATLTNEFNQVHEAGFALDGNNGYSFFSALSASTDALSTNQGGAGASTQSITDTSLLTLDEYEIRFTGAATFDVINTTQSSTVLSGQAYVSGNNINFDGLRIQLSDLTGAPVAGDTFRVSSTKDTAQNIQLAITDMDNIAAAAAATTVPGDNRNALALMNLRNSQLLEGNTVTFGGFFQTIIGDVGAVNQNASRMTEAKGALYESMDLYRQSLSGVSLEEEQIRLISYQHAYQAASNFMEVTSSLLETLMNMV